MAREQWKAVGVIGSLIGLLLAIVGIAYASGGKVIAVEKDIESVALNACEDRKSVEKLTGIVDKLEDKQAEDYKELKESDHAAAMRDKEQAMQYSQILGHMAQQTAQNQVSNDRGRKMENDITEMKVQMKTLIPE